MQQAEGEQNIMWRGSREASFISNHGPLASDQSKYYYRKLPDQETGRLAGPTPD
jgi:hypothetical protein